MANPVCNSLKIELSIVQAAMGGASCPELAAAVSNAGGLGMLALSWSSADDMRREIRKTRGLTVRPFGVNLVLEWPQEDRLALCLEEGVAVVSFFWGQAGPLTEVAHVPEPKCFTPSRAPTPHAARSTMAPMLLSLKAGRPGAMSTARLPLWRLCRRSLIAFSGTPVIAAGGIADGRGLAAAMALGASGAWIGTRFLASPEAAIHSRYRDLLLAAKETDTEYGVLFDLHWPDAPHRTLRNATFDEWQRAGRPARGKRPGEGDIVAKSSAGANVRRYESYTPSAGTDGDIDALSLWAGQGVGLVHRIQPASEIVREIAAEAQATLSRLASAAKFLSFVTP